MADVVLKLVADNSAYIQRIKEAQTATQKLYEEGEKGSVKRRGLIENEIQMQKQLKAQQEKAHDLGNLKIYNGLLEDSKKRLNDMEQAGTSEEKSGNSLLSSVGKWVMGFATFGAAIEVAKKIIASTESVTTAFKIVVAEATSGIGYFFKAIASGDWSNFGKGLKDSIEGAKKFTIEMVDLQNRQNEQLVLSAEASAKIAKLREDTFDKSLANNEKLVSSLKEIIEIEKQDYAHQAVLAKDLYQTSLDKAATDNKISKDRLESLVTEYTQNKKNLELGQKWNTDFALMRKAVDDAATQGEKEEATNQIYRAQFYAQMALEWGKVPEDTRKALAQLKAQQIALEGQAAIGSRRDENQLAMYENKKITDEKDAADKILKIRNDTTLASMEGYKKDQLALKFKYEEDISKIKDGESNANEQKTALTNKYHADSLALEKTHQDELSKIELDTAILTNKIKYDSGLIDEKTYYNNERDLRLKAAEVEIKDTEKLAAEKLKINAEFDDKQIEATKKQSEKDWNFGMKIARDSFAENQKIAKEKWDKMLADEKKITALEKFSEENRKQNLKSFADSAKSFISTLSEIADNQVNNAQRNRELLDTRISEAESALQTETELYKAGYASNVDAKKQEVESLKKQRDKALADEEKARKKQHAIQLASLLAEKAGAIASVIVNTQIANAKAIAASPLTFGLPWVAYNTVAEVISIAAIVAAMALAATSKYAKGGYTGMGTIRDETKEKIAGIVHEEEFVVSKKPTKKYRQLLEAINSNDTITVNKAISILNPDYTGGQTIEKFNSNIVNNKEKIQFIKLNPEVLRQIVVNEIKNNIKIDNSGSNKRLDNIHNELKNNNKKPIKEEIFETGKETIIIKGQSRRTIRNGSNR